MRKDKGNILVIVLASLLILSLGFSAYLLLQNKQTIVKESSGGSPTTVAQDETANWKTYADNRYNFSLKYPNNQYVGIYPGIQSTGESGIFVIQNSPFDPSPKTHGLEGIFYIKIYPNVPKNEVMLTKDAGFTVSTMFLDKVLASVGIRTEQVSGIGDPDTMIFVSKGSFSYLISYPNSDWNGRHSEIFDQILSTFKFL
ncbi:MAG: hypothetical protein Q7S14_03750 [bacterium]|nr:hypothetical protein [bacterium]